jgi:coenzyme F420-reducing hydrogenase delta subunit
LYAIDNAAGHICQECFGDLSESGQYTLLSQDATEILRLLPEIGMHLDRIKVSTVAVSELNRYFLQYYQVHQKQTLKLKSLSVLCQFYD